MDMEVVKDLICRNKEYIIKNTKHTDKVVKRLKERHILTSNQTVDFKHVIEEVIQKNKPEAFVAVLEETGNLEVVNRVTNLSENEFDLFVSAKQAETNNVRQFRKTSKVLQRKIVLEPDEEILRRRINYLQNCNNALLEENKMRTAQLQQKEEENQKLKGNQLMSENNLRQKEQFSEQDTEIRRYEEQIQTLQKENTKLKMKLKEEIKRQSKEVEEIKKHVEDCNHEIHSIKTELSQMKDVMSMKFDQIFNFLQTKQTTEQIPQSAKEPTVKPTNKKYIIRGTAQRPVKFTNNIPISNKRTDKQLK